MTTLTHPDSTASTEQVRRSASRLERLAELLVWIRSTAGEGLEATVARSVDQAFSSFAREYRR